MSDKIQSQHLARKAVLYVRQSSAYQVMNNHESRRLQYAMQDRLRGLGWKEIEVIDEDLGKSAAGGVLRSGFQRMVAEVCLRKVGVVAAREVSRFARNSHDWQQLIEVCRVVDTLLIDQETVYSPRLSNDRLLLGLKGSLNEYELDLLRQRSVEARYEKARRGELVVAAPVGYQRTEDGRLEKNPDRRVRETIELVFRKFMELGTVRQTLLWFLEHHLDLPTWRHVAAKWETAWKRPGYATVYRILTHPAYGGAYVYGRSGSRSQYDGGQLKKTIHRRPKDQWLALIPGAHEGYIDWEQFQQVQEMISANFRRQEMPGAAKQGSGLLAGLLRCRRCGQKLMVHYTGKEHDVLRYACKRGWLDTAAPRCIAFGGIPIDESIAREVLRVVQPAAIDAAVLAGREAVQKQDEVLAALEREQEASNYAATRAWKQYDASDPENRLVTEELERRWNQALERVRQMDARIEQERHHREQSSLPSLEEFKDLATDLQAVWDAPSTDVRLKKRIVRTLIQEVIADTDPEAGEILLTIHWRGGVHTELRLPRRRRGTNNAQTPKKTVEVVRWLARICSDDIIAGVLNRNGLRTGRGNRWTQERVASLRSHQKIPRYDPEQRQNEGWLTLTEAAGILGISSRTLRLAVERGEIAAEHPLADGPWILKRCDLTTEVASQVVARARRRRGTPAVPNPQQKTLGFLGT